MVCQNVWFNGQVKKNLKYLSKTPVELILRYSPIYMYIIYFFTMCIYYGPIVHVLNCLYIISGLII